MPCNCNVRVRATPPSAQAESQTVVQRLRQQAGRSRQAARQAAPACSRPFELVGTLHSPVPLVLSGWGAADGRTEARVRKMQNSSKANEILQSLLSRKKTPSELPISLPGGRPLVRRRSRASRSPALPGEHAGLIVWQGSACLRKVGCTKLPTQRDRPTQSASLHASVRCAVRWISRHTEKEIPHCVTQNPSQ